MRKDNKGCLRSVAPLLVMFVVQLLRLFAASSAITTGDAFRILTFPTPSSRVVGRPTSKTAAAASSSWWERRLQAPSGYDKLLLSSSSSNDESSKSQWLLSLVSADDGGDKDQVEDILKEEIASLESSFNSPEDSINRFDPLIGLYEVKCKSCFIICR